MRQIKISHMGTRKKLFPIHKSGMLLPENAKIKFRNMAREKKSFPASRAGNNLQEKCENKISHCAKKNYSRLAETVSACLQCEKKIIPGGRPEAGRWSAGGRLAAGRRPAGSRRPSRRRVCVNSGMRRFPTVLDGAGGAARLCWTAPAALLGCAGPRLRRFLAVLDERQPWPKNTPKKNYSRPRKQLTTFGAECENQISQHAREKNIPDHCQIRESCKCENRIS